MQVKLLRSNSRGIEGTYDNANCHAKTLLPLLDFLRNCLEEQTGYQEWVQGNNIHLLRTRDGRMVSGGVRVRDFEEAVKVLSRLL